MRESGSRSLSLGRPKQHWVHAPKKEEQEVEIVHQKELGMQTSVMYRGQMLSAAAKGRKTSVCTERAF